MVAGAWDATTGIVTVVTVYTEKLITCSEAEESKSGNPRRMNISRNVVATLVAIAAANTSLKSVYE